MPADCDVVLPNGEPCGVAAIGRCATDQVAFCVSHRAIDRWGNAVVNQCAPCFEMAAWESADRAARARRQEEEARTKAEERGRASKELATRLKRAGARLKVAREAQRGPERLWRSSITYSNVGYWDTPILVTLNSSDGDKMPGGDTFAVALSEDGRWGRITWKPRRNGTFQATFTPTEVNYYAVGSSIDQIFQHHKVTDS